MKLAGEAQPVAFNRRGAQKCPPTFKLIWRVPR
jgi:hypothetical protein